PWREPSARPAGRPVRDVAERPVDVGVRSAADLVDYRFGQALYASWLAGLTPTHHRAVRHAVIDSVSPVMAPYRPIVVLLVATQSASCATRLSAELPHHACNAEVRAPSLRAGSGSSEAHAT
nr:hypothetical protein [Actinomycetota bacterium]